MRGYHRLFIFSLHNLEHGSLLWSSSSVIFCDKVERMQRNFLRFLDFYQSDCSYYDLCKKFNVDTLHLRRMVSSIMFCFDVITSKIDCSAILSQINFNCASRSLHFNEFLRPVRRLRELLYMFFEKIPGCFSTF